MARRTVPDWPGGVNSSSLATAVRTGLGGLPVLSHCLCRSTRIEQQAKMWRTAKAPSLVEIEVMAVEVYERLPQRFRSLCEGLVIQVEDFPTDEVLETMGAESEFDLLGLFQGVGLPFRSVEEIAPMPNMIWLYRRPILDYWAEHDETLGHIVRHVLVHEIGHHFGLSDEDMEAIEAQTP